jgi:hypothetical protein
MCALLFSLPTYENVIQTELCRDFGRPGEEFRMLKLRDRMTACAECLKIYSPPPTSREVFKCFNKDISVTWLAKVLSISLPARDLYLCIELFAPVQRLLEIYLFT